MKRTCFFILIACAMSLIACSEKIDNGKVSGEPSEPIDIDDLIGEWNVVGDRWDLENGVSACYLMDDDSEDGYAHDSEGNLITITVKEYCQSYADDYNADPANEIKGTAEDFADKLYSDYGLSGTFEVTEERITFTWGLDVGFSALYVDGSYTYDAENGCMTVMDEAIPSDLRELQIDVFNDEEGRMCFRYPEYYISTMYDYDQTQAWWIYAPVIFYCERM